MRKQKIYQFIAELKAAIPLYREVWMTIALSCQPIEQQKASAAIKTAYAVLGKLEPELYFCESPVAALDILASQLGRLHKEYSLSYFLKQQLCQLPMSNVERLLWQHLGAGFMPNDGEIQKIKIELGCGEKERQTRKSILNQCGWHADFVEAEEREDLWLWQELLWSDCLKSHLEQYFHKRVKDYGWEHQAQRLQGFYAYPIQTEVWAYYACWLDLCSSVFHFIQRGNEWDALQEVVKQCGWLYPMAEVCLVCDRPRVIPLDDTGVLHSFGSQGSFDTGARAALQFSDGFSLFASHGKLADANTFIAG